MPEAGLSSTVDHADHNVALGVVTGGGESSTVRQDGLPAHHHAAHAPVFGIGVLGERERKGKLLKVSNVCC